MFRFTELHVEQINKDNLLNTYVWSWGSSTKLRLHIISIAFVPETSVTPINARVHPVHTEYYSVLTGCTY